MKRLVGLMTFALCFASYMQSYGQKSDDPVLLTFPGSKVTKSEFLNIYNKNSTKESGEIIDKKSLEEYLELFINFKLKVKEAEELGLDTTAAFKGELDGYRKQLAQPYLVDKEVSERLMKEAYERMNTDVRASHILIRVRPGAPAADTLAAYNRTLKIKERVTKGEDFEKVARETSEDPSVKENGGDLGYFPPLRLVYPFEDAAYKTEVDEVTGPVRTKYGYHLIKVTDKRTPALGEVKVSHIMVKATDKMSPEEHRKAEQKINEIYEKLQQGEDFESLAKNYSDDKSSARRGGDLPWFTTLQRGVDFENAAYKLKNIGEVSEPIKTPYGWHILKLVDRKEFPKFDDVKLELKNRISRDSRSELSVKSLITRLKKEYKFKEYAKSKKAFYELLDSTHYEGKWDVSKAEGKNKKLFVLHGKTYNQNDFAHYIHSKQRMHTVKNDLKFEVDRLYDSFVDETVIKYEDSRLAEKYPEFRLLMQEYHDGILLFELMDRKVWSKAVKDTAGLEAFHEKNKDNYMWNERVEATIYTAASEEIAAKVRSILADGNVVAENSAGAVQNASPVNNEAMIKEINSDSQLNLKIESGSYQKGDHEAIDAVKWKEGISDDVQLNGSVVIVKIDKVIPPQPKSLKEARGLVTADYQTYLEKKWIDELRAKYPVDVNNGVLDTIQ